MKRAHTTLWLESVLFYFIWSLSVRKHDIIRTSSHFFPENRLGYVKISSSGVPITIKEGLRDESCAYRVIVFARSVTVDLVNSTVLVQLSRVSYVIARGF